jgi:3-dehydro-4-phosphotetronate decarboxylase
VIHSHSTYCVLQSLGAAPAQTELLLPLTPYFVMKVGHVPLMAYHRPGDPAVAALVAQTITQYGQAGIALRAVMLARLGPNVWHTSPEAAMAVLEELEETAKLAYLSSQLPAVTPEPLSEVQIQALRTQFAARW